MSCLCCAVLNPYEQGVLLRLGNFVRVVSDGIFCMIPCIDSVQYIDTRDRVVNLPQQEALTKDNLSIKFDATIQYSVQDAQKALLSVSGIETALLSRVAVEVRQAVAQHELSEVNKDREAFATSIVEHLKDIEDDWGLHIKHVQLNDIRLDQNLRAAMASLAEAQVLGKAKLVNAKADVETAEEYAKASKLYDPISLRLREFQLWQSVSQQPGKLIMVVPSEMTSRINIPSDVRSTV
jgi:erythrocyte band 7 integral membrane protein